MPTNPVAAVIDLLDKTREEVEQLLSAKEHTLFKTRVVSDLKKQCNFLRARSGMPLLGDTRKRFGPIPLEEKPAEESVQLPSTKALEAEELQKEVNAVYEGFVERENDDILDSVSDLVIRGVAKKAGMQVSQTEPEKLNAAFVDQIKEAIKEKAKTDTLIDDPKKALQEEYDKLKAEADQVAEEKATLLKEIDNAKVGKDRKSLEVKLQTLEAREAQLIESLIVLEEKLDDGSDD